MAIIKISSLVLLLLTTLISAIAVIYCKHNSRLIYIEMQKEEKKLLDYEVEWRQMQIELNLLSRQNHVEAVARNELKLIMPQREKIIYIEP